MSANVISSDHLLSNVDSQTPHYGQIRTEDNESRREGSHTCYNPNGMNLQNNITSNSTTHLVLDPASLADTDTYQQTSELQQQWQEHSEDSYNERNSDDLHTSPLRHGNFETPPAIPLISLKPVAVQSSHKPQPSALAPLEKPKRVFARKSTISLKRFLFFQFPAISISTILVGMYSWKVSWNPDSNQLGALLFAAKIHEALIVVSLFDIISYHLRRGILGTKGVPYGFLTAPFQLASPWYMFKSEFRASFRSASRHSASLAALLILSFVLAALAGASSGIIMLPKLVWWPISETGSGLWDALGQVPLRGVVIPSSNALYPLNISPSLLPPNCLNVSSQPEFGSHPEENCPFKDFNVDNAEIYGKFKYRSGIWSKSGVSVISLGYPSAKSINFRNLRFGNYFGAAATGPLGHVENALTDFVPPRFKNSPVKKISRLTDARDTMLPTKQPQVVMSCSAPSRSLTGWSSYAFNIRSHFYPELNFKVNKSILQVSLDSGAQFGFVDINDNLPEPVIASVAMWIRESSNPYDEALIICLIDARWVEASAWVVPSEEIYPAQHSATIDNIQFSQYDANQTINIAPSWCNILNATMLHYNETSLTPEFTNTSAFELLRTYMAEAHVHSSEQLVIALTIFLTDALSWSPYRDVWEIEFDEEGAWTPRNYVQEGYGDYDKAPFASVSDLADPILIIGNYYYKAYGYEFGEITTILSWVVIFLHYALVISHLIITVINKGWTSSAWDKLGDLLTLAMNSSPTALLENTGSGVKEREIWRLTAYVREAEDGERIELVLKDNEVIYMGRKSMLNTERLLKEGKKYR